MKDASEATTADQLVASLFRHESARLVASLVRLFGPRNLDLAEDIVQEALEAALQAWKFQVPDNPAAWLSSVARNRAIDVVRRQALHRRFSAEHASQLTSSWTANTTIEEALEEASADENQLRMMLTLCHPKLSQETHVTLILKFLCGFGTRELAGAFLTSDETINKRVQRGRSRLKAAGSLVHSTELTGGEVGIQSLLDALYLLFNEGYHGSHPTTPVRAVLCEEAIRLCSMLIRSSAGDLPQAHALMSLMYFHYARIRGRLDEEGVYLPLALQDRLSWDQAAVQLGIEHLGLSASGRSLSPFHLEAGIACKHCLATSFDETDWQGILELYLLLAEVDTSPIVSLNVALARAFSGDPTGARRDIGMLEDEPALQRYPFYWAARAEICLKIGESEEARCTYEKAAAVARNEAERCVFRRRAQAIERA